MSKTRASVIAVLISLSAACGAEAPKSDTSPAPAAAATPPADTAVLKYDMKGKVLSVDKPAKMMTVDHEAIANFMGAMTMPYAVRDERALETAAPGDQITAKVVSSGSGYWLEEVVVTEKAKK